MCEKMETAQAKLQQLLDGISKDAAYENAVFEYGEIYFTVGEGRIWEISDNASYSPRGSWFPDIVSGPTGQQAEFLLATMERFDFEQDFFDEALENIDFIAEGEFAQFFEENGDDEKAEICERLAAYLNKRGSLFADVESFAEALSRLDLDPDLLYYFWEGDWIDMHDNIGEFGEEIGSCENYSTEEWIDILEHIDQYRVYSETNELQRDA